MDELINKYYLLTEQLNQTRKDIFISLGLDWEESDVSLFEWIEERTNKEEINDVQFETVIDGTTYIIFSRDDIDHEYHSVLGIIK